MFFTFQLDLQINIFNFKWTKKTQIMFNKQKHAVQAMRLAYISQDIYSFQSMGFNSFSSLNIILMQ